MPGISVVVPARDVVDHLSHCLDDLRAQTLEDFEVLVVDDGSTDGTPQLIDRFAAADPRFRALASEGRGPSAARNLGLEHASGEEIAFVDADDRVAPHYLERLHGSLAATGSDLACCNVRRLKGLQTTASGLHGWAIGPSAGAATHLRKQPQLVYDTTIWNKLFRRELWTSNGVRFPEGRWINDIYPSLCSHVAARQVDVLTEVLYYWRVGTEHSPSITSSKFVDPAARLKSLADRFEALERSRRLLTDRLADPVVLDRFDERIVWHDLLPYLVMFRGGADVYRDMLVHSTGAFLRRHGIDPARYPLGTLLHRVYEALFAADHEALEHLLDPRTCVTARAARGRVRPYLEPSGDRPERPRRRLPRVRRGRRSRAREQLEAMARVTDVALEPSGHSPLTVSGSVRIRDGRSDVMGVWRIMVELVGRDTSVTIGGGEALVGELSEHDVHPMLGSGWRPFVASVDPVQAGVHVRERCWRVRLELRHEGGSLTPTTSYSAAAVRGLGGGRAIGAADLVPVPDRWGNLELRREDAPVRLRAVDALERGRLVLGFEVDEEAAATPDRVWLRQGHEGTPGVGADSLSTSRQDRLEARLDLGDGAMGGSDRWELWCRVGGVRIRVRAAPALRTTPLPSVRAADPSLHAVLRPTVRGRVVLEAVERRREVDELSSATDAPRPTLLLAGPATYPPSGPELLEARCRWTDVSLRTGLESGPDGWSASLAVADLVGEIDGKVVPRRWALHRVDSDGSTHPVRVPPGGRHRFPATRRTGDLTARLEVGAASSAHLLVAPADVVTA